MVIICETCKNSIQARRPSIFCGNCKKQFHSQCISNCPDLPNLLNDIRGLSFKCDQCINDFISVDENGIKAAIEKETQGALVNLKKTLDILVSDLLESVNSKLQSLSRQVAHPSAEILPQTSAATSYAKIVRNKAQPAIIVKPKDSSQEHAKTKTDMLNEINPADSNIQLSRIRTVKDGGVLIGCKNPSDNKRIKHLVEQKLSDAYEVREVGGINPRIRLVGITKDYNREHLLDLIKKCNPDTFSRNSSCEIVDFRSVKNNKSIFQVTLQVDKCTFEAALFLGYLFVNLDCCKVFNAVEVYRCYNCNEFHHSSKNCNNSVSCPRCGQNHKVNECKSHTLTCSNCVKLKEKNNPSIKTDHAAWDLSSCLAYKQARDRLLSDVLAAQ